MKMGILSKKMNLFMKMNLKMGMRTRRK